MKNPEMGPQEPEEVPERDQLQLESELVESLEPTSLEKKIDMAANGQDEYLSEQESQHDRKTLSGLKKWAAALTIMGSSLLALGCHSEGPSVEKPEPQKTESKDGFTSSSHEYVQQKLKNKKAEIKRMKEMKGYKPGQEAKQAAKEMNEEAIVKPIRDAAPGPSGRVSNPEDL
jgi:hypothetical protein